MWHPLIYFALATISSTLQLIFVTLSYTKMTIFPTLLYTASLQKAPLSGGEPPRITHYGEYPLGEKLVSLLLPYCFLNQSETSFTLSLSTQVYSWVTASHYKGNQANMPRDPELV